LTFSVGSVDESKLFILSQVIKTTSRRHFFAHAVFDPVCLQP